MEVTEILRNSYHVESMEVNQGITVTYTTLFSYSQRHTHDEQPAPTIEPT